MAAQMILGLSILVGIHEAGHMIAAKFFGMRVEKFSIGFPPKIFGFRKGETEYSLGAIPLGGFVKISGMIDESLDTSQMSKDPEPYEFRAKPAWQRLIVMMGGIIVNVIAGIIIFIALAYIHGEKYYPMAEVNKRGIVALDLGKKIGFQTGDKVISVNGKPAQKFSDVLDPDVLLSSNSFYTVERNGETVNVLVPNDFIGELSKKRELFIMPIMPFQVDSVVAGTPASQAGLKKGDQITQIGGKPVNHYYDLKSTLADYKGKTVDIQVNRGGASVVLKADVKTDGTIGFFPKIMLEESVQKFGVGEAAVKGTGMAFSAIVNNVKGLGKIFRGEVSAKDSLSGPIGIAREFGGTWDWNKFWHLVGLLSMVLAFMNFLPIPALDGGHVAFLSYEMISGRKPSDKFLEGAQKVGMVLLLALMVFAFGNDIMKFF